MDSKIVEKRNLIKGQRIQFSEVRIRTLNPGKVGVFFDVELSVYKQLAADYLSINDIHNLGKPEPLHLRAGDSINYLQYLGEGTCVIQFHGEMMICAKCYWLSKGSRFSNHFNYQSPVKIERWINLGKKGQNPGAWLRITSETMESNFILSP